MSKLNVPTSVAESNLSSMETVEKLSVKSTVYQALMIYFSQLGGQRPKNVYDILMEEVERPMLEAVMNYVGNNQSLAAEVLGISRGTLRKLLKKYGFID